MERDSKMEPVMNDRPDVQIAEVKTAVSEVTPEVQVAANEAVKEGAEKVPAPSPEISADKKAPDAKAGAGEEAAPAPKNKVEAPKPTEEEAVERHAPPSSGGNFARISGDIGGIFKFSELLGSSESGDEHGWKFSMSALAITSIGMEGGTDVSFSYKHELLGIAKGAATGTPDGSLSTSTTITAKFALFAAEADQAEAPVTKAEEPVVDDGAREVETTKVEFEAVEPMPVKVEVPAADAVTEHFTENGDVDLSEVYIDNAALTDAGPVQGFVAGEDDGAVDLAGLFSVEVPKAGQVPASGAATISPNMLYVDDGDVSAKSNSA